MADPLDPYLPDWRATLPPELDAEKEERKFRILIGELQAEGVPLPEAVESAARALQRTHGERIARHEEKLRRAERPPSKAPPPLPPPPSDVARRKVSWIFFWIGLLCAGAAFLLSLRPKEFQSMALVAIEAGASAPRPTGNEVIKHMQSEVFLRSIAQTFTFKEEMRMGESEAVEFLRRNLTVSLDGESSGTVTVIARSTNPYRSAGLANLVADEMVRKWDSVPPEEVSSRVFSDLLDRHRSASDPPLRVVSRAVPPRNYSRPNPAMNKLVIGALSLTGIVLLITSYALSNSLRRRARARG